MCHKSKPKKKQKERGRLENKKDNIQKSKENNKKGEGPLYLTLKPSKKKSELRFVQERPFEDAHAFPNKKCRIFFFGKLPDGWAPRKHKMRTECAQNRLKPL